MTIALKPCPSGHTDVIVYNCSVYYGACRVCGWNGPIAETEDEAAEKWNYRPESDELLKLREAFDSFISAALSAGGKLRSPTP